MTVLTFGAVAEITGKAQLSVAGVASTHELKEKIEALFPLLKHTAYAIAVNKQIATEPLALQPTDTVALLPPFSGG